MYRCSSSFIEYISEQNKQKYLSLWGLFSSDKDRL